MKWDKIRTEFPKSWELLEDRWDAAIVRLAIKGIPKTGYRFLYDFFDEQEIYIHISSGVTIDFKRKFLWKIYENENIPETAMMPCICETRIEAEEKAFTEAFKILEEKLVKILTKQE